MRNRKIGGHGGGKAAWVLYLLFTVACGPMNQSQWLAKYDRDIDTATKAVEASPDDAARARAFAERGRAYSEKARYSKSFHVIGADEYGRLFDLALGDHDRAIELAPGDAEVYLSRGLTYYDRAALEDRANPGTAALFASAAADFTKAVERDGRQARAYDMLGLVHTSTGDHDGAIAAFTEERKLEASLGTRRLAEAYCNRGSFQYQEGRLDAAASDYERSIELGTASDGCDCQPDHPLAEIYFEQKQFDRSWEVVNRARAANRWVAPELVEKLKQASGRPG